MDKTARYTLIGTIIFIGAISILAISLAPNQEIHLNPPAQPMSDEEYLRVGVDDYLMSDFNDRFPAPDYDVSLEDQAVNNAIRGEWTWLKVSGNTAEESLKTLIALDAHYSCNLASFWLETNQRDYPGTKYAIGVYKTSYSQYNISVVIEKPQPDTQELNRNGAWITVRHNPVVSNFKTRCNGGY